MIDRIGNSVYSFTPEAQAVIAYASNFQEKVKHPELSPRHIGVSLINSYKEAFGDLSTRQRVRRALVDWESENGTNKDEKVEFFQIAFSHANPPELTGRKPIAAIDLLYALLTPDLQTPPTDPLPFVSGDQLYPLIYREKVFFKAGGTSRHVHFDSPSYQVALLDLGRADRLRRTGLKEFTFIPADLLNNIPQGKAS